MPEQGAWTQVWTKISSVRQGTGVVGKLCSVAIAAIGALAVGLYSMPQNWFALGTLVGMAMVVGVVLIFVSKVLQFARDHPEYAAVEGKHLVDLRKLEIAAKGRAPALPSANVEPAILESKAGEEQP